MLRACPAGHISASSGFGRARSARRDEGQGAAPPARRDPYLDFVFVLQPEGKKKTKPQQPFQFLQMKALCPRLVLPPCFFQHPFEPFTTFPARNAAGLPEPGGLFSKSGRLCAGKKHPGVLSRAGEGGGRHPMQEGSGGCGGDTVPASPGCVRGISLPALARRLRLAS